MVTSATTNSTDTKWIELLASWHAMLIHWVVCSRRLVTFACLFGLILTQAQERFVDFDSQGRLVYEESERGDRIPDFSSAGYGGGGVELPLPPARIMLQASEGEDGQRIQAAIDYLATLQPDPQGWRGVLLLGRGSFEIEGQIHIHTSGIILRGSGEGEEGTRLMAMGQGRRALIRIQGDARQETGKPLAIAQDYLPVGDLSLRLEGAGSLRPGQRIRIRRPSPQHWIDFMGMASVKGRPTPVWKKDTLDVIWEREVVSVSEGQIQINAPLTCSLDQAFGGGWVQTYAPSGRIHHVGIEHLELVSVGRPNMPKDEEHAWMAVTMNHVENAWVRQVTTRGFVSSAVNLMEHCRHITVMDCQNLAPVSELGGYRRHAFHTAGQQTLFLRCFSEDGRHDFSTGWRSAGPNAFVFCEAKGAHDFSGPIESWSTGVLLDNLTMDGGGVRLDDRELWDNGVGWAAANSVIWQCSAPVVVNRMPPGAQNWAIGCWAQFVGNGNWRSSNEFVDPESLYRQQLRERLGQQAVEALNPTTFPSESAPVWHLKAGAGSSNHAKPSFPLQNKHGWLVVGNRLAAGRQPGITWWRGHVSSSRSDEFGINLTRFAPGLHGRGLTDDLQELGQSLAQSGAVGLRHHPGLWYDRRRDDHEMIRRIDGDVWPPFYELPWARSGQGTAWDGLSLYDLSQFNPWYFQRLRDFAQICEEKALVFINAMYFQHNILEAGAHWADYPWRSANNINHTGFPEPPPYQNRKRIFMDEAFYDTSDPVRVPLHQRFIQHSLANLRDSPNVIHLLGEEYSGPLSFTAFWLDTVARWSSQQQVDPLIGLSAPKDVQDAILADDRRNALVDVIDFKYWWVSPKGLYAPEGGLHLAPRQHERLWKGGRPNDETLATMAAQYRQQYPEKAIICDFDKASWAFLCAGGSMPNLPASTSPQLLEAIPFMDPWIATASERTWGLWQEGKGGLIYIREQPSLDLDLRHEEGSFEVIRLEPKTGQPSSSAQFLIQGGQWVHLPLKSGVNVLWIRHR